MDKDVILVCKVQHKVITKPIFKLVGLLSMDEASHLRELQKEYTGRDYHPTNSSALVKLHSGHPTLAPTSCRIISWITTSASVLKSWTNFLFLSSPVFSCTRSWKRGASCLQTRATFAAFSATRSSSRSKSAMPDEKSGEFSQQGDGNRVCVWEKERGEVGHTFPFWANYSP